MNYAKGSGPSLSAIFYLGDTLNTKQKGDIAVGTALARFLKKGWVVLSPFGDNQRYDLVIDRGLGFERIQVKAGYIDNGYIVFNTCSVDRGTFKRQDYNGQIEFFAVCPNENDNVYLVPPAVMPKTEGRLRIASITPQGRKVIPYCEDYKI